MVGFFATIQCNFNKEPTMSTVHQFRVTVTGHGSAPKHIFIIADHVCKAVTMALELLVPNFDAFKPGSGLKVVAKPIMRELMQYDPENIDEYELAMRDEAKRDYMAKLAAHPDCLDPNHPGCKYCENDGDEEFETCAA